ncbi:hypothetical protein [Streptomyces sp. NPDC003857]
MRRTLTTAALTAVFVVGLAGCADDCGPGPGPTGSTKPPSSPTATPSDPTEPSDPPVSPSDPVTPSDPPAETPTASNSA